MKVKGIISFTLLTIIAIFSFACGEEKRNEKLDVAIGSIKIASNIGSTEEYALPSVTQIYEVDIDWEIKEAGASEGSLDFIKIVNKDKKEYLVNMLEYDGNAANTLSYSYTLVATIAEKDAVKRKEFSVTIEELPKGEFDKVKYLYNMATGAEVKIKGIVTWTIAGKGDGVYNTFVSDGENIVLVFRHTGKVNVGDEVIVSGFNSPYGALPEVGSKNGVSPTLTITAPAKENRAEAEISASIGEINAIDKTSTNFYRKIKVRGIIEENNDSSMPFIIRDRLHENIYLEVTKYSFDGETYSKDSNLAKYILEFIGKYVDVECFLYSKGENGWQVVLDNSSITLVGDGAVNLTDKEKLGIAEGKIKELNCSEIVDNVDLKTNYDGVSVHWGSKNTDVLGYDGKVVNRPETDLGVGLVANLSIGSLSSKVEISIIVKGAKDVSEVKTIESDKIYKLALFQQNLLKFYFFTGTLDGGVLSTTSNSGEGKAVKCISTDEGFYIALDDNYINIEKTDSNYKFIISSEAKTKFYLDEKYKVYALGESQEHIYLVSFADYTTVTLLKEEKMDQETVYSYVRIVEEKEAVLFRGIVLTAENLTGSSVSANYSNEYQEREVGGVTFTYVRVSSHGDGIQMPKQEKSGDTIKPAGDFYNTTPIEGVYRIELICTSYKTWNPANITVQVANNADFSDAKTVTPSSSDDKGSVYQLDGEYSYIRISHTKSGNAVYMEKVLIYTNKLSSN